MKGSLLEACYRRGGFRKGVRVGVFILDWAMCSQEVGHEPTITEFITWSKEPRTTVFNHLREFREVFPEWETPQPFADEVDRRLRARRMKRGSPAAVAMLHEVAL